MATPTTMTDLSVTAASNSPAGSESPTNGDDFLRAIQAIVRRTNAKGSDIASATTTDIGAATAEFVDVTGTTTITGLGTIDAGIVRTVRFTGALTLTHNATSLILPSGANITTAANDIAVFRSLGSGNWICVGYKKQDGTAVSAPFLPLSGGTVTGATTISADMTFSGATLKLVKGADVASATALPLITDGNYFDVTGTTTVTSFNSVGVGTWVALHFDGALTLTHHATDLILPGAANITTAAGDEALFIEYASGDYRCVSYTKASGLAVISSYGSSSVSTTTGGTAIEFTSVIPTWANEFTVHMKGFSTNGTSPYILQVGVGGVYVTTGYESFGLNYSAGSVAGASQTAGIPMINVATAAANFGGQVTFKRQTGNIWTASGGIGSGSTVGGQGFGDIDAGGVLDSVRWTTVGGANTVDVNGGLSVSWSA